MLDIPYVDVFDDVRVGHVVRGTIFLLSRIIVSHKIPEIIRKILSTTRVIAAVAEAGTTNMYAVSNTKYN